MNTARLVVVNLVVSTVFWTNVLQFTVYYCWQTVQNEFTVCTPVLYVTL